MKLYIFGNGNLGLEQFLIQYCNPLRMLDFVSLGIQFLLCDFRGVDTLMMEYLKTLTPDVSVYHVGEKPRYLPDRYKTQVSQWQQVGGFASDADRDAAAIAACSHFLAYDFNSDAERKSGTQRNIERCLELGKQRIGPPPAPHQA